MNRYEPKVSRNFSPFLWLIVLIIMVVIVFLMFQRTGQVDQTESKVLEIPEQSTKPNLDQDTPSEPIFISGDSDTENQKPNNAVEQPLITPENLKLDLSDNSFRKEMAGVSESMNDWLDLDGIIRKYMVIMNDLSQNQILYKHRRFLKMSEKMLVKEDALGLYMDKQSYHRYDGLANAIASINVEKGKTMYFKFRPLIKQVFDGFGYPTEYQVDDIFLKAAASVIDAPQINGRISLIKDTVTYKFADKQLESMNGVKKQMIRMGPENTRKIQAKLRKLVEAIVVGN